MHILNHIADSIRRLRLRLLLSITKPMMKTAKILSLCFVDVNGTHSCICYLKNPSCWARVSSFVMKGRHCMELKWFVRDQAIRLIFIATDVRRRIFFFLNWLRCTSSLSAQLLIILSYFIESICVLLYYFICKKIFYESKIYFSFLYLCVLLFKVQLIDDFFFIYHVILHV